MNKPLDEYPEILTCADISEYLHLSRRRVYELLKLSPAHGGIPSFEIGASKRAKRASFKLWVDKLEQEQTTKQQAN